MNATSFNWDKLCNWRSSKSTIYSCRMFTFVIKASHQWEKETYCIRYLDRTTITYWHRLTSYATWFDVSIHFHVDIQHSKSNKGSRNLTKCVAWNILRYANRSRTFDCSVICITHNMLKVRKIHNRSRISRMKWNGIVFTQFPTDFSRALYSTRKETDVHI